MLRPDHFTLVVEIDEVTGQNINGTDGEVHFAGVDEVEVDEIEQRPA